MKEIRKRYFALNKPAGYVCALKDNVSPTIMELVPEKIKDLHIVGRLDKDTTGIIILTNDGQYTHNSTHPRKHVDKEYEVTVEKPLGKDYKNTIESGMFIDYGETHLKPGRYRIIDSHTCLLKVFEGKFHQVKKMFAALDNKVLSLHRVLFDKFDLRELKIEEGKYIEVFLQK